ncbi:MAG: helix-hairpin-helix domain-containing protein [Neobacillus sp.]
MKDWIIKHRLYVIAAVLVAFAGSFFTITNQPNSSLTEVENVLPSEITGEGECEKMQQPEQDPPFENMIVDVKGQVMKPGVYQANQGERIIDVISRAGGLTELADESQVNFAEHVQDAMVIYIPAQGEEGPGPLAGSSGSTHIGSNHSSDKINLNKADENELQNLPGIGPAKAAAIIEYRETIGAFKAIEDLKNISGIGDKTFEKLKDLIDVR